MSSHFMGLDIGNRNVVEIVTQSIWVLSMIDKSLWLTFGFWGLSQRCEELRKNNKVNK